MSAVPPPKSLPQAPAPSAAPAPDTRPQPLPRTAFRHGLRITTRWGDNDVYGHVNNVVYYGWFDTVVNRSLIEAGVLDIHGGEVIGLVVETRCHYFAPLAFPQEVDALLRVEKIGRSSVTYRIGLFAADDAMSAAHGHFTHVYVDRATRRPVALPAPLLGVLNSWT